MTPELHYPVLDCFMRALPFTYRNILAARGTAIRVTVSGECGGKWNLYREDETWLLIGDAASLATAAEITIPQEIAWRIFTKGIFRDSALSQVQVSGDPALALHALSMVSIVSG